MADWRNKIEGLFAKSMAAGTTPEERDALQDKAIYLMTKYGVEEATLRKKDGSIEKPIIVKMSIGNPYAMRKAQLLGSIAHFLGGKAVGSGYAGSVVINLLGFSEDIERIKILYSSLTAQLHMDLYSLKIPQSENAKAYRNAFMVGFGVTVTNRLEKIYNSVSAIPGTDIVLRDRKDVIEDLSKEAFPNLKKANAIQLSSQQGWDAGVTSGNKADLGQDRLDS